MSRAMVSASVCPRHGGDVVCVGRRPSCSRETLPRRRSGGISCVASLAPRAQPRRTRNRFRAPRAWRSVRRPKTCTWSTAATIGSSSSARRAPISPSSTAALVLRPGSSPRRKPSRSIIRAVRWILPTVTLYVADTGHGVIDKFGSTGIYEGQLTGTCEIARDVPGLGHSVWRTGRGVAVDPGGNGM